jgi:L-iditol 2-dehydrogenase
MAPRVIQCVDEACPQPAPGEVLIELSAVGVCGSDVHWYLEGRIGETVLDGPLVLGHEPVGRVVALGGGSDPQLLGRRVAIEPTIPCGKCPFCLRGDSNICPQVRFLGTPPTDGAFRRFMTHPARLVVPLPDCVSDASGVLLEPLAIGIHAVDLLRPRIGAHCVIQGAGAIGLSAMLAMGQAGAGRVIVVEPLAYRREMALGLGADVALGPDDPDLVNEVRRLTGGYGADVVIEAVGVPDSFARMADFAQPGAKVAVIGIDPRDRFALPHGVARRKGLTFYMVRRSRNTLERAIALTVARCWDLSPMATHRRGLAELANTMDMVAERADGVLKAIVDPRI